MPNENRIDAVFEGGGVKGTGLVGAIEVTEQFGYTFHNIAGTSAGAIVAALVAAGYTASELRETLLDLDYNAFKDEDLVDQTPLIGPMLSLAFERGIYEGDYFESWIGESLKAKGVETFGDLVMPEHADEARYRYQLCVIATDLTNGRMLVLPHDIKRYGIEPDALDVARAIRMSMSIPFFFEPVVLEDARGEQSYIVDGGVLSNFPVWLFDSEGEPAWPTIGYKLVEPDAGQPRDIGGPVSLLGALFATMMEAHDARYIEDQDFVRTVPIPTGEVQTTDFDIDRAGREGLLERGREAATEFFDQWDFERYKAKYRTGSEPPSRTERL